MILRFALRPLPGLSGKRSFSVSARKRIIDKLCSSAQEAIKDMKGGTTLLVGGFGFAGVPNTLINAVRDRPDLRDFTAVSNNAGMPGEGLGNEGHDVYRFCDRY